jgi:hypothetical protein
MSSEQKDGNRVIGNREMGTMIREQGDEINEQYHYQDGLTILAIAGSM